MPRRFTLPPITAAALGGVFVLLLTNPLEAQHSRIPRTAAGKPDLSGIWQAMTTANFDIEPHDAKAAMAMRPGPVVPVPAKEVVALGAVGAAGPARTRQERQASRSEGLG